MLTSLQQTTGNDSVAMMHSQEPKDTGDRFVYAEGTSAVNSGPVLHGLKWISAPTSVHPPSLQMFHFHSMLGLQWNMIVFEKRVLESWGMFSFACFFFFFDCILLETKTSHQQMIDQTCGNGSVWNEEIVHKLLQHWQRSENLQPWSPHDLFDKTSAVTQSCGESCVADKYTQQDFHHNVKRPVTQILYIWLF